MTPLAARADCASDCEARYHDCARGGNPDACLSAQGVCLNRCTLQGSPSEGSSPGQRHGAIAYSVRKEIHGYSYGYDSEREASGVALRNCRAQHLEARDCRVLVTFHNACGALARGAGGAYGAAWGRSGREAEAKALEQCRRPGDRSCRIERRVCSGAR